MNGYKPPINPPTTVAGKEPSENNGKSMNLILYGLSESEFVKVMHCELAKEIWDKLQNIFEGNNKVNKVWTPSSLRTISESKNEGRRKCCSLSTLCV